MHSFVDDPNLQVVKLDEDSEEISTGPERPVFDTSIYFNALESLVTVPPNAGLLDKLISTRLGSINRDSGTFPSNL